VTLAELHGKLTAYEQSEDLLTSDVFGTFKYVEPQNGLLPFLQRAKNILGDSFPLPTNVHNVEYLFWPKTTGYRRESDVLCILTSSDGTVISVMVECKYTSPKSNSLSSTLDSHGDQLAEQFVDLMQSKLDLNTESLRKVMSSQNKYVFYVTAHYGLPRKEIQESIDILLNMRIHHPESHIYWVSWRDVHHIVDKLIEQGGLAHETEAILCDLRMLLNRKGLTPFHGFGRIGAAHSLSPGSPFFWRESQPYNK
jgi:hypothetical protein